jgi:DNA-binding response OmpR family regulator
MPELILVVEDDRDLAEAMAMILELDGFATMVAHDGREALACVERQRPSLIVLDMLMPIMNGWDFARELDRRYGRVAPILVVTAAENAAARAREVAASDVLGKPFDAKTLVARVRALTARDDLQPRSS